MTFKEVRDGTAKTLLINLDIELIKLLDLGNSVPIIQFFFHYNRRNKSNNLSFVNKVDSISEIILVLENKGFFLGLDTNLDYKGHVLNLNVTFYEDGRFLLKNMIV